MKGKQLILTRLIVLILLYPLPPYAQSVVENTLKCPECTCNAGTNTISNVNNNVLETTQMLPSVRGTETLTARDINTCYCCPPKDLFDNALAYVEITTTSFGPTVNCFYDIERLEPCLFLLSTGAVYTFYDIPERCPLGNFTCPRGCALFDKSGLPLEDTLLDSQYTYCVYERDLETNECLYYRTNDTLVDVGDQGNCYGILRQCTSHSVETPFKPPIRNELDIPLCYCCPPTDNSGNTYTGYSLDDFDQYGTVICNYAVGNNGYCEYLVSDGRLFMIEEPKLDCPYYSPLCDLECPKPSGSGYAYTGNNTIFNNRIKCRYADGNGNIQTCIYGLDNDFQIVGNQLQCRGQFTRCNKYS